MQSGKFFSDDILRELGVLEGSSPQNFLSEGTQVNEAPMGTIEQGLQRFLSKFGLTQGFRSTAKGNLDVNLFANELYRDYKRWLPAEGQPPSAENILKWLTKNPDDPYPTARATQEINKIKVEKQRAEEERRKKQQQEAERKAKAAAKRSETSRDRIDRARAFSQQGGLNLRPDNFAPTNSANPTESIELNRILKLSGLKEFIFEAEELETPDPSETPTTGGESEPTDPSGTSTAGVEPEPTDPSGTSTAGVEPEPTEPSETPTNTEQTSSNLTDVEVGRILRAVAGEILSNLSTTDRRIQPQGRQQPSATPIQTTVAGPAASSTERPAASSTERPATSPAERQAARSADATPARSATGAETLDVVGRNKQGTTPSNFTNLSIDPLKDIDTWISLVSTTYPRTKTRYLKNAIERLQDALKPQPQS